MTPPADEAFAVEAAKLFRAGMGTEHVAPLLHGIIRMTRPRRVLEIGLGYTTLFLLDALAKARTDQRRDRALLADATPDRARRTLLNDRIVDTDYQPRLIGIDDFSLQGSSVHAVAAAAETLGLAQLLTLMRGDFRTVASQIGKSDLPFDMIWYDCGGAEDYADFLRLYWPLLSPNYGLLGLHYTYGQLEAGRALFMRPTNALNAIKREQGALGNTARFEVLSLLEPHKLRQGSVTLVRKLPPQDRIRDQPTASFDLGKG